MEKTTLLEGGCPCFRTNCPNHSNCAACIKRHVENTDYYPYCIQGKKEQERAEKE